MALKLSGLEFRIVHPDGSLRHVKADALVMRDADGHAVRVVGLNQDVTGRKRAEQEKAKLEAQLIQAQKMETIGRLAGGVAHDFNNLLTIINGYSGLSLSELDQNDPLYASLEEIKKAGERAAALTQQLLAFSRKQVLAPRLLSVDGIIQEMQKMLARLVGEDVEVGLELNAAAAAVRADRSQLQQVLMNLVVNARDAMPTGGRLTIATRSVDGAAAIVGAASSAGWVLISVQDTGIGMDAKTLSHLFEPFFTTKKVGEGTGLGLSTVHGIIAQSGGCIEVDSALGEGTIFRIYLPLAAEFAGCAAAAGAESVPGGKETVLVVEDQETVRRYASAVLKRYGYRVFQVPSAGQALAICEREGERIDLVVTDVVMPNVSGRELAERLNKLRPGIKVLYMSGYTGDVVLRHGVREEDTPLLHKPFTPEDLARKVREVLGATRPRDRS